MSTLPPWQLASYPEPVQTILCPLRSITVLSAPTTRPVLFVQSRSVSRRTEPDTVCGHADETIGVAAGVEAADGAPAPAAASAAATVSAPTARLHIRLATKPFRKPMPLLPPGTRRVSHGRGGASTARPVRRHRRLTHPFASHVPCAICVGSVFFSLSSLSSPCRGRPPLRGPVPARTTSSRSSSLSTSRRSRQQRPRAR